MNLKLFWKAALLCLILIGFIALAGSEDQVWKKSPYLNQKPPGNIPEIFAPGIISTGSHETDICFTPDGRELFFTRSGPDFYSSILYMNQTDGEWEGPKMAPFFAPRPNSYPFVFPRGKTLIFNSPVHLPGVTGKGPDTNLYISRRSETGWEDSEPLASLNTPDLEGFAAVASNGNIYFFARYKDSLGGFDLYMARRTESGYSPPLNLGPAVNTKHNEFHPYISPDEKILVFDAQRPDGFGANDLYISLRKDDGTWTNAQNMGEKINTRWSDLRPFLTPDGRYFFFCSNRPASENEAEADRMNYREFMKRITGPGNGSQDIYWVDASILDDLKPKDKDGPK
jgi:hypothetical protein